MFKSLCDLYVYEKTVLYAAVNNYFVMDKATYLSGNSVRRLKNIRKIKTEEIIIE